MITAKINCSRILKEQLYVGKNGKYLDLALFTNRDGPDQYGNDGFITQGVNKETRARGQKGPIIGTWKEIKTGVPNKPQQTKAPEAPNPLNDTFDNDDAPW